MVNLRELDPGASPLAYFGSELRRLRQAVGQTQEETGRLVFLTGSQIGQFENAVLMPKREQVEMLDQAVEANGALLRTWPMISRSALPQWFQKQANVERKATEIYSWHTHLVHGLLQTEEYARAVLAAMHSQNLDARVEARIERQAILRREDPPVVWAVISEAVLHQEIGGKAVMRRQLGHLLGFRENDLVNVQVLPFSAGVHAGLMGAFTLLRFGDMPDVAYDENYDGGTATVDPAKIRDRALRYDHLQAAALSIEGSAALIARVMEERYGEESGDEA
ncbi:helix-turn-helix domain-containing protein [Streptomyces sp. 6N223]|uniref:helix-turn-helix domain-containing protein n=1 Tax=Streptomyces sp. 6N223 TaxID=3457412 RepID=UPI003FCFC1A1